jgi:4-hydroxy-tetrahydrodipicolinate synthase
MATTLPALSGVIPVMPTPFDAGLSPDPAALRRLVRYALRCGVHGLCYPGVASEVSQLSAAERVRGLAVVVEEAAGRVPVVAGVSADDTVASAALARDAARAGASALMLAALPGDARSHFTAVADAAPGVPLMLQNLPPPGGADLAPLAVLALLEAVPAIRYVKEEALPSGQRLSALLAHAPPQLRGVLGGAGGRYITDELRRGACGTMPALELAEVHVALWLAHQRGDAVAVRTLFARMLPLLNLQAVFRWALTKEVLRQRGLLDSAAQRVGGPQLDSHDRAEIADFLADLSDLLLPRSDLSLLH